MDNQKKDKLHQVGHSMNTPDDSLVAFEPLLTVQKEETKKKNKSYHQQFTLDTWSYRNPHRDPLITV